MDNYSTPNYNRRSHRGSPNYFKSGSSYKSPQDRPLPLYGSPDFQPYNYSSPVSRGSPNFYDPKKFQQDRNPRFYGNQSIHSPYDRRNRPNYGNQNRGWQNYRKKDDISAYVSKSMLEDPWAELEKKADTVPPTTPSSSDPLSESSSSVAGTSDETVESSLQLDTDDGDASLNISNLANSSNVSSQTGASPCPPDEMV